MYVQGVFCIGKHYSKQVDIFRYAYDKHVVHSKQHLMSSHM